MKKTVLIPVLAVLVFSLSSCATNPPLDRTALAEEYHAIASAYADLKKFDKAGQYFARALELDAGLVSASYNFGRTLVDQGRFSEAMPFFKAILETDPGNGLVREALAYCLLKTGSLAEAKKLYTSVLSDGGERVSVLVNLARIEVSDSVASIAYLERASRLQPDNPLVLGDLAMAYSVKGQHDNARPYFDRYRSLGGRDVSVLDEAASNYERGGFFSIARKVYDELADLRKDQIMYRYKSFRMEYLYGDDTIAALTRFDTMLADGFNDWKLVLALYKEMDVEDQGAYEAVVKKYLPNFPELPK